MNLSCTGAQIYPEHGFGRKNENEWHAILNTPMNRAGDRGILNLNVCVCLFNHVINTDIRCFYYSAVAPPKYIGILLYCFNTHFYRHIRHRFCDYDKCTMPSSNIFKSYILQCRLIHNWGPTDIRSYPWFRYVFTSLDRGVISMGSYEFGYLQ